MKGLLFSFVLATSFIVIGCSKKEIGPVTLTPYQESVVTGFMEENEASLSALLASESQAVSTKSVEDKTQAKSGALAAAGCKLSRVQDTETLPDAERVAVSRTMTGDTCPISMRIGERYLRSVKTENQTQEFIDRYFNLSISEASNPQSSHILSFKNLELKGGGAVSTIFGKKYERTNRNSHADGFIQIPEHRVEVNIRRSEDDRRDASDNRKIVLGWKVTLGFPEFQAIIDIDQETWNGGIHSSKCMINTNEVQYAQCARFVHALDQLLDFDTAK